ncbi:enoyl-CoA hydratase-related protein [Paenibacillus sp. tmac-D7]|uniref:enoyl-CoA hydratase-related protein n=1 Tax=Paenibacillus sp. tmac-D7 TaxID=2591462 RepID=UPI0015E8635C
MNGQLFRELGLLFNEWEQNDDVRAVVLTGKGDRAFAAGAGIKDMLNLNTREVLQFCQVSRNAFSKVESLPKPVIAAVNGLALGGGATQRLQRLIGQLGRSSGSSNRIGSGNRMLRQRLCKR